MYVGKISPVVSGNYKIAKTQKAEKATTNAVLNNSQMSKDMANALKAQVSFGNNYIGIQEGLVEGKPSISAMLNGFFRIDDELDYKKGEFQILSTQVGDKRQIEVLKGDKKIIKGYISDDLSPKTQKCQSQNR